MTLTLVDVAAVTVVVVGPVLVASFGVAIAWLRADAAKLEKRLRDEIAKLEERQRADTAAINMRLDTLTQTIITSAIARGSHADLPTERTSQTVSAGAGKQP